MAGTGATRRGFVCGLGVTGMTMALPMAAKLYGEGLKPVKTYTNPLPIRIADPYVLKVPGSGYVIYGTGGGGQDGTGDARTAFPAWTSKNLVEWTPVGEVLVRDPATSWSTGDFWAPEVYHVGGRYVMVYSAQWRHNPTHEAENFRVGVAVSDTPTGPFRDLRNEPVFDPGYPIIDADVLFDEDGRMFLYYSRCCYKHPVDSELARMAKAKGWYAQIEESWIYGVELRLDFSGVIGEPVVVLRPPERMDAASAWEDVSVTTHEAGRRWTEGPCAFKEHGTYFMMYSADSVFGNNYSLGYATASHPLGPYVRAGNNPVLRKTTTTAARSAALATTASSGRRMGRSGCASSAAAPRRPARSASCS